MLLLAQGRGGDSSAFLQMPICEGVYPPLSLALPKKERGTRGERKALSLVAKWVFAHLAGRELLVRSTDILLTSFRSLATAFGDFLLLPLFVVFPHAPLRWARVGTLKRLRFACTRELLVRTASGIL